MCGAPGNAEDIVQKSGIPIAGHPQQLGDYVPVGQNTVLEHHLVQLVGLVPFPGVVVRLPGTKKKKGKCVSGVTQAPVSTR